MAVVLARRAYWRVQQLLGRQRRLLATLRPDTVLVLNLHRVHPCPGGLWDALHPDLLNDLIVFIRQHSRIVTFRTLATEDPRSGPWTVLSFDDGYQDFVEYARPVLEAQGVAANLNVIVQCLEDGLPPWTSRITDYLSAIPASTRASLSLPGIEPEVVRSPKALSRTLKNRPRAERAPLWDSFQEQLRDIPVCWTPMMSRAEVIDAATKHEIGCHSSSHDSMGCESMQFFVADLETCEEYFEKDLRLPLEIYAFPNGSYRPQHLEFLAGTDRIKSILIVEERRSRAGATIHPRITFNAWTSHEARLRALGARTAG